MTEDLHTYAGLYALDAIDGEVLTEFEQHLSTCASCQQEVREFSATAGRLGSSVAVAPPPALRDSVLSAIGNVRQEAPAIVTPIRRQRPAWFAPFAVAAALVLAFGVLRTVTNRPTAITAASVINARDARAITLTAPDGVQTKAYVSAKLDRVALTADGMTPAPPGKSYQLWLIGPKGAESAGIMDPPPGGAPAAVLLKGRLSGHQRMSITLEPAGGLPKASGPTLVEGSLT
jgi:anti-sigma-K factor RskA